MNKKILRMIFAWAGIVSALGAGVSITLFFFNILGEMSDLFANISLGCVALTAVFFIIAKYVLGEPSESDGEGTYEGSAPDDSAPAETGSIGDGEEKPESETGDENSEDENGNS